MTPEERDRLNATQNGKYAQDPSFAQRKREYQRAYHTRNRERNNARQRDSRDAVREKENKLQKAYGLTLSQRDSMLTEQAGICRLCPNKIAFTGRKGCAQGAAMVDHCHTTGKVRGILCGLCNLGLGAFMDSADTLRAAAAYVEAARGPK